MRLTREWLIVVPALVCLLVAGCGAARNAAAPEVIVSRPSAEESAQSSVESQSTVESQSASCDTASFQAERSADLQTLLTACVGVQPGAAGCSLRSASAAAGLVEFSATHAKDCSAPRINDQIKSWYNALSADDKNALKDAWPSVYADAQSLVADPKAMTDQLSDAGVTTNFAQMDLTDGMFVANYLQSLLGGK